MNTEKYDRDTKYWDDFYLRDKGDHVPSLFAEYVWNTYLQNNPGTILELGCGNGRDSEFFLKKGIEVTAIDASKNAIDALKERHVQDNRALFICGDFVKHEYNRQFKYCYSRFTIHAITEEQENTLISTIGSYIEDEGYILIEARSVNDELYGKGEKLSNNSYIYNDHFRRFIRMGDLITKLENVGFIIDYAAEKRGFAPHGSENPHVIRIIGKKQVHSKGDRK